MRYDVEYGKGTLSLDVPEERVIGTMGPRRVRAVPDVLAATRRALEEPLGTRPLGELLAGKRSALIVTVDHTRPSPQALVQPVLDACARLGVKPTIIIATGRHRPMTERELRRHLGPRILRACPVLQHDPFDERGMVDCGVTSRGTPIRVNGELFRHEVVIGCGIVEPSYLAGWSGGRKLLMPGLAHHESIDNNHFYITHLDTRMGRLTGNPVSEDAAEFAAKLPFHLIVYSVSGPNDEVTEVVAGHPVKAHVHACLRSERIYRVRPRLADIVISSAGGHPYDCDLVQGKKAIIPAAECVKRNGVIILCSACPDGLGAEKTFIDWLRTKTPTDVVRDAQDRKLFSLGAHGANILARPIVDKNANVIMVTRPEVAQLLQGSYVTPLTRLTDAWRLANLITGKDSSVLFIRKARRLIVN
ncbi:MAG: hypothetical protein A3K18_01840 [Lentisphaerae bacterium RIFOXYA12_64_32]|nr:MAG: hypothetical protein A3K18_01840 [Lentisphaerae bacterium RIFOXYA12_64_32]